MIENGINFVQETNKKLFEKTGMESLNLFYSTDGYEDSIEYTFPTLYSSLEDEIYDENDNDISVLDILISNLEDNIDDLNYLLDCLREIKENS